jgi:erythromycin esterase
MKKSEARSHPLFSAGPSGWLIASILALSVVSIPSHGSELSVKNLNFESWNANSTKPDAWIVQNGGYQVSSDCVVSHEGKCSLRLESEVDRKQDAQIVLAQGLPSTQVGAHRLKMSGWIRTKDLKQGFAALIMQVNAKNGYGIAGDDMHERAPRGTTEWQHFEVQVPVAAKSWGVIFGIKLTGSGVAWFEGIKLEVDDSAQASDIPDIPEIVRPPRPNISTALQNDTSLALVPESIPNVKQEWRDNARKRAHIIRSLVSDDFHDLQFLKPLLEGKRVVQLGENSHGVAEFNWMKVRLIKFLHQQMGFDVVAFESSLTECDMADEEIDKAAPIAVMQECIFGIWSSSETLDLFDYMDRMRKSGSQISLAGFDIQFSGNMPDRVAARFKPMLEIIGTDLSAKMEEAERKLHEALSQYTEASNEGKNNFLLRDDEAKAMADTYSLIFDVLSTHKAQLYKQYRHRQIIVDMAIEEAKSRASYVKMFVSSANSKNPFELRDKAMATNLDFLLDVAYPKRKIIVWAHNTHIAKQQLDPSTGKTMGVWVAERHKQDVFTIGLYMGRGIAATPVRELYEIAPPPPDSLEAIMASVGTKVSFLDFGDANPEDGSSWMLKPIIARSWGVTPETIVPAKAYDAVIYIDTVTPPDFK